MVLDFKGPLHDAIVEHNTAWNHFLVSSPLSVSRVCQNPRKEFQNPRNMPLQKLSEVYIPPRANPRVLDFFQK